MCRWVSSGSYNQPSDNSFLPLTLSPWRGERICLKGVEYDEKMDEPFLDIEPCLFFPPRVCGNVERYQDSMFEMRLLL